MSTKNQRQSARIEINTELYAICLTSRFALEEAEDSMTTMNDNLKALRSQKAKIKRLLERNEKIYEKQTGRKPLYNNHGFPNV